MGKIIEKAANEYAANWEAEHNIHNPELYDLIVDAYKAGAERVMSLPLAERVTEAERERVRETYVAARDGCWDECNDMNIAVESVLEDIFGADFFGAEAPVLKQNTENENGSGC